MSFPQGLRSRVWRVLRWALYLIIAVLVLPYLLTPLYRFVPPVSTLMVWRLVTGERVTRTYVPLSAMAPILPRNVLMPVATISYSARIIRTVSSRSAPIAAA